MGHRFFVFHKRRGNFLQQNYCIPLKSFCAKTEISILLSSVAPMEDSRNLSEIRHNKLNTFKSRLAVRVPQKLQCVSAKFLKLMSREEGGESSRGNYSMTVLPTVLNLLLCPGLWG